MTNKRQLRQIRLEPKIADEFKTNADAWVLDIAELFDEVILTFLREHEGKEITYLSQPKGVAVTNVRLLSTVLEKAEERAKHDSRTVPTLLYTAFIWFAKVNNFSISNDTH